MGGYQYTRQTDNRPFKTERTRIRWRCVERTSRCRGTAVTDMECRQCSLAIEHNHAIDQVVAECAVIVDSMKVRAECSRDKPGVIVAEGIHCRPDTRQERSAATRATIKLFARCVLIVARVARHPQQPTSLVDLHVTGSCRTTTGDIHGEPFLQHDSGAASSSRMLVFATARSLQVLCYSKTWFMDGNFTMAPKLFAQVTQLTYLPQLTSASLS